MAAGLQQVEGRCGKGDGFWEFTAEKLIVPRNNGRLSVAGTDSCIGYVIRDDRYINFGAEPEEDASLVRVR